MARIARARGHAPVPDPWQGMIDPMQNKVHVGTVGGSHGDAMPRRTRDDQCVGMDEVGRGALAGPLVAAAVILPRDVALPDGLALADSKCLTAARRVELGAWIHAHAGTVMIEQIGVDAINRLGIGWANRTVYQRLMARIGVGRYVVDGNLRLHGLAPGGCRVMCMCDGDARHVTVAAASIVAKVYRDSLMQSLHQAYPRYGWATNAGYATAEHRAAVHAVGPCGHHRSLFLRRVLETGSQ